MTLDDLVASGDLKTYEHETISDTNRNGDDLYVERLTLIFSSGAKLEIDVGMYEVFDGAV